MNIKPNPSRKPASKNAGEAWLRSHDPEYKRRKRAEKRKKAREAVSARRNPILIGYYRKAMLRRR